MPPFTKSLRKLGEQKLVSLFEELTSQRIKQAIQEERCQLCGTGLVSIQTCSEESSDAVTLWPGKCPRSRHGLPFQKEVYQQTVHETFSSVPVMKTREWLLTVLL